MIFATTRHGGHLGYFEGGFIVPETTTWIDRLIIQYCDAIAAKNHHIKQNGYWRPRIGETYRSDEYTLWFHRHSFSVKSHTIIEYFVADIMKMIFVCLYLWNTASNYVSDKISSDWIYNVLNYEWNIGISMLNNIRVGSKLLKNLCCIFKIFALPARNILLLRCYCLKSYVWEIFCVSNAIFASTAEIYKAALILTPGEKWCEQINSPDYQTCVVKRAGYNYFWYLNN